jgi:hypothetical protein
MPYSKTIFQQTVLSNGTLFIGLFLRSRKNDINGVEDDQFYWLQTTASGTILDLRENAMNDYFTSLASALANPPSGYSAIVNNFNDTKDIGYNSIYPYRTTESYAKTLSEYADAAAKGATYILVDIDWDGTFATWAEQTTNASAKWLKFDNLINYAKGLLTTTGAKMKVSIRILLAKDDSAHYDLNGATQNTGFYGLSESALNELGYPGRIASGNDSKGIFSLADTVRTGNGVGQGLDFVQKVLQRYNSSLAATGQWNWFSVDTTAQHEAGYDYENQHYEVGSSSPTPLYPTSYDYSTFSVGGFKASMQTKYTTPAALNTAWGSGYGEFSDIVPPKAGVGASQFALDMIYSTTKGKDWWFWNYTLVKNFNITCRAKGVTYAPSAKYTIEGGSFYDTPRRMLINVSDMASYSDMIKTVLGRYSGIIQTDILASNYAKKIGAEINTSDIMNPLLYAAPNVAAAKEMMLNFASDAIGRGGAKDILFMSNLDWGLAHNACIEALAATKIALTNSSGRVGVSGLTANYSLGQLLDNPNNLYSFWVSAGGSDATPVNMVQSTDILPNTSGCAFPLSLYPIHQFCLKQEDLKSKYYTGAFDNSRVTILAPTHSITYLSGAKALSSYQIKSTDGVVWLSNVQNLGATNAEYSNNHPSRRFTPSLIEDAEFLLPIQDYDIVMTNTGAVSFLFEVYNADPDSLAVNYSTTLAAGATATYRVYAATMNQQTNWNRLLKINCNRF